MRGFIIPEMVKTAQDVSPWQNLRAWVTFSLSNAKFFLITPLPFRSTTTLKAVLGNGALAQLYVNNLGFPATQQLPLTLTTDSKASGKACTVSCFTWCFYSRGCIMSSLEEAKAGTLIQKHDIISQSMLNGTKNRSQTTVSTPAWREGSFFTCLVDWLLNVVSGKAMPGPPASLVEDQVLCVRITLCEALMVERGVCELREQTHTGKSNRLPESEGGVGVGGGRRMQAKATWESRGADLMGLEQSQEGEVGGGESTVVSWGDVDECAK